MCESSSPRGEREEKEGQRDSYSNPKLRKLAWPARPMTGWSWMAMPSFSAALRSSSVMAMSAAEGSRSAEGRSEEHTSELQSLMSTSYAVFCLEQKIILISQDVIEREQKEIEYPVTYH